mgnify:CR=1 FL=1
MIEYKTCYQSPLGWLEISGTTEAVTAVRFVDQPGVKTESVPAVVQTCRQQLDEYFQGQRTHFDLPLAQSGTPFQQAVWGALTEIPFAQTASYGQIAHRIDNPKAVRAVGSANGKNNIVIIVPCHRVIGNNGKLTGYGGGLWRKEWLLNHERQILES